jgi:hypothetical protein
MNRGFTLRRNGLSTDTRISLLIGVLNTQWTASVVIFHVQPIFSQSGWSLELLASLAEAPLLS